MIVDILGQSSEDLLKLRLPSPWTRGQILLSGLVGVRVHQTHNSLNLGCWQEDMAGSAAVRPWAESAACCSSDPSEPAEIKATPFPVLVQGSEHTHTLA